MTAGSFLTYPYLYAANPAMSPQPGPGPCVSHLDLSTLVVAHPPANTLRLNLQP